MEREMRKIVLLTLGWRHADRRGKRSGIHGPRAMFVEHHLFDPDNGILKEGMLHVHELFVLTNVAMHSTQASLWQKFFIGISGANTT